MRISKHLPISRSEDLISLSREHHDGLLLSWKINTGLNKEVSTYRIRDYVLYFFDNFLEAHFIDEEEQLYTLLDEDHADRRIAELQHAALRVRIEYFRAGYPFEAGLLRDFANLLSEHIRFEERTLSRAVWSGDSGQGACLESARDIMQRDVATKLHG